MLFLVKWTQADVLESAAIQLVQSPPGWGWLEMAFLPDMMALPGLLAGSVLLLVLASNPVWGENSSTTTAPTTSPTSNPGPNIAAIVAPIVIVVVLAIASAVLAWLFCVVRKKRQTEGTYHPSAEEQSGARSVATPDTLKLPKEERLIWVWIPCSLQRVAKSDGTAGDDNWHSATT